jgi:hypothetical protein
MPRNTSSSKRRKFSAKQYSANQVSQLASDDVQDGKQGPSLPEGPLHDLNDAKASSPPSEHLLANTSASNLKLSTSIDYIHRNSTTDSEYRLYDTESLRASLHDAAVCSSCFVRKLTLGVKCRWGWAAQCTLICKNCDHETAFYNSPKRRDANRIRQANYRIGQLEAKSAASADKASNEVSSDSDYGAVRW